MRKRSARGQWDAHAIKAEIHRRGKTLTALAEEAGLEASAVRVALCRRHTQGEAAIAEFIGEPLTTLWPDRYRVVRTSDTATTAPTGTSRNGETA